MSDFIDTVLVAATAGGIFKAGVLAYEWWQGKGAETPSPAAPPSATARKKLSPAVKQFLQGAKESASEEKVVELLAVTMTAAMNINSHFIGKGGAGREKEAGDPIGSFLVAFGLIALELLRRAHKLDAQKIFLFEKYKVSFASNLAETLFAGLPEDSHKQKAEALRKNLDHQERVVRAALEGARQGAARALLFPLFDVLQPDLRAALPEADRSGIIKGVMPRVAQEIDKILLSEAPQRHERKI